MRRAALISLIFVSLAPDAALADFRVVNGRPAAFADLRATVALIAPDGSPICTGTLVEPDVVATAAHCVANPLMTDFVAPNEVRVTIGVLNLLESPAANLEASIEVAQIHAACGFLENGATGPGPEIDPSGLGRGDDVAFLALGRSVPSAAMRPVPILPSERRSEIAVGTALTVTGFGIYDVSTGADGVLHTGETRVSMLSEHELMTERSPDGTSTDSCNGDSGGPLYYTDSSGNTFLVGITSRAAYDSPVACGDGGIYGRAPAYRALLERARARDVVTCEPGEGTVDDDYLDELHDHVCLDLCAPTAASSTHALCRACSSAPPPPMMPAPNPMGPPTDMPMECVEMMEEGGCSVGHGRRAGLGALLCLALLGLLLRRKRRGLVV